MAKNKSGYAPSKEYAWRKEEVERIETQLMKKSKTQLVALLMQITHNEPDLQCMIGREMIVRK